MAARLQRRVGDAADRADGRVHGLKEAFEYLRVAVNRRQRAVNDGGDVVEARGDIGKNLLGASLRVDLQHLAAAYLRRHDVAVWVKLDRIGNA